MIKNYLLIFFRNIARNRTFSVLNVGGFALGMAACVLILLFISHEKSFDSFHSKADRIYRLNEWQRFPGMQEQHVALSMYPMAPALLNDHPEIETYVRIESKETAVTRNNRKELAKHHLIYADSTFFQVFDFPVLYGDKNTALLSPSNIAITASIAKELFGTQEALNKIVEIKQGDEFIGYTVALVMEDIPANSFSVKRLNAGSNRFTAATASTRDITVTSNASEKNWVIRFLLPAPATFLTAISFALLAKRAVVKFM